MQKIYLNFLMLISCFLLAQQDVQIAFYKQNLQLYNPAATGLEEQTTLSSGHRSQWSGIEGAPSIQAFNLSIPEGEKRLGYGAMVMVDQTFVERQTRLFASFSYRLPVDQRNSLYLGIQGGGNHINLNFTDLNLANNDDGRLKNFTRFYPNIGVGVYFEMKKCYFSFSAPLLFSHKKEKKADAISLTPADDLHLYFSTGVRLPAFADDWNYIVSTLIRWVPNAPTSSVINIGLTYQKSELLLAYHLNSSLGVSALFDNGGPISFGYAYQFSTPSLASKLHAGNHELIFRIRFKNKKTETIELDAVEKSINEVKMN